jgi:4-amino-4-deoxy-L-arabinose transferase-like glycosyltransferase
MGLLRSRRVLYLFLGLYAATLILLIPAKPLWMDEIIDLNGVRNADLRGVLAFVPGNAGGVPLGYLADFWMIQLFGYSVFIVRLPSVLFTVLACAGVYILARQTRLQMPLLAVILYAVSPLTLRYALEARPYAQATCWSVFSTVIFLSLIRQPKWTKAASYAALVAAGLFTQPYSIFVPVAHLTWLLFTGSVKEKPRAMVFAGGAVALASLSFLPWYFKAHAAWQGAVNGGARFLVTGKDLLVIPHELMGTGFIGSAVTIIAIVMALAWSSWYREEKIFWSFYAVIPLLLVPAADAYFGYFLAVRQMIFVLVPISVLVIACTEMRWAWLVPVGLCLAMVYEDVNWIRRPGEGWQAAAVQLVVNQTKEASCTIFASSGARTMYLFFEPHLRECDENTLMNIPAVALALNPDQNQSVYAGARQKLNQAGLHKVADLRTTDPRIELYRR